MKRIITITLMLTLVFSSCAFSCFASSSSKGKYVKIKASTLKEYKAAARENEKLKKKLETQKKQLQTAKDNLKSEKSKNNWVWNNLYSIGITYNNKTWSIPRTISSKFMINGVIYYAQWE